MKLSTREDIALGIDEAFRIVTDFPYLERQILRRGIDIARTDLSPEPGVGMAWAVAFDWKSGVREAALNLSDWVPPERAQILASSSGIAADLAAEFTALSRRSTRLRVSVVVRATTFRDRMLLQSLTLAKARLLREFEKAVAQLARDAERRAAA